MSENDAGGAKTLEQHLALIASNDSIDGLDPSFHGAVRPVAKRLLSGRSFEPSALAELTSSAEMAAIAAGLHLRSLDVVAFWQPLLKATMTGSSHAPVADLSLVSAQARMLMALLEPRDASEMRDKVLLMATEAAARTEKWLPRKTKTGGGPSVTRYKRGVFMEDEDEDGNPVDRKAVPRRVKIQKPESAAKKVFAWILTIALIGAMGFGIYWVVVNNQPEPLSVEAFSVLVPKVTDKRLEGTELVLTVNASWVSLRPMEREGDLRLLMTAGKREKPKSLRMVDSANVMLAQLLDDGEIVWGEAAKTADQLRTDQEAAEERVELEASGKVRLREDGKLSAPLRADQIPTDD